MSILHTLYYIYFIDHIIYLRSKDTFSPSEPTYLLIQHRVKTQLAYHFILSLSRVH